MFSPKSMISLVTDPLKGLFFSTFSLNFFLDYFQHIPFYLVNCCIFCLYLRFEKFIIFLKKESHNYDGNSETLFKSYCICIGKNGQK